MLRAHGYLGAQTRTAPGAAELAAGLLGIESVVTAMPPGSDNQDYERWSTSLPANYQRAGPEIYRNIRATGAMSIRHWLQENHVGSRTTAQWAELRHTATAADFAFSEAKTDSQKYVVLGTSDQLELALRHLAAHTYEARTKDSVGAARIRATAAPGSGLDTAPEWLMADATTHSKMEYQRSERVNAEWRRRNPKGKGKGDKDKGKGKPNNQGT